MLPGRYTNIFSSTDLSNQLIRQNSEAGRNTVTVISKQMLQFETKRNENFWAEIVALKIYNFLYIPDKHYISVKSQEKYINTIFIEVWFMYLNVFL